MISSISEVSPTPAVGGAAFSLLAEQIMDHLLRKCAHEPGLFRTARPTADAQTLLSALELGIRTHGNADAAASGGVAAAWVSRRLAEEGRDPHLVAAALLLLFRSHPPLIPAKAWKEVVSFENSPLSSSAATAATDNQAALRDRDSRGGAVAEERAVASAREALTSTALREWRELRSVCQFLARLASLNSTSPSSSSSSSSGSQRRGSGSSGAAAAGGAGAGSGGGGTPACTPAVWLAHAVGPSLARPEGSAYMGVNHCAGLSSLRALVRVCVEHHSGVFAEQHAPTPQVSAVAPSAVEPSAVAPSAADVDASASTASLMKEGGKDAVTSSPEKAAANTLSSANNASTATESPDTSVSISILSTTVPERGSGRGSLAPRDYSSTSTAALTSPSVAFRLLSTTVASFLTPPVAPPSPSPHSSSSFLLQSSSSPMYQPPLFSSLEMFVASSASSSSSSSSSSSTPPPQSLHWFYAPLAATTTGGDTGSSSSSSSDNGHGGGGRATGTGGLKHRHEHRSGGCGGGDSGGDLSSVGKFAQPRFSQVKGGIRSAAERRRTVGACRALRAQIKRFEDASSSVSSSSSSSSSGGGQEQHQGVAGVGGGKPHRRHHAKASLTSTYAQYKEWKRAIRDQAASTIQHALFFRPLRLSQKDGERERRRPPPTRRGEDEERAATSSVTATTATTAMAAAVMAKENSNGRSPTSTTTTATTTIDDASAIKGPSLLLLPSSSPSSPPSSPSSSSSPPSSSSPAAESAAGEHRHRALLSAAQEVPPPEPQQQQQWRQPLKPVTTSSPKRQAPAANQPSSSPSVQSSSSPPPPVPTSHTPTHSPSASAAPAAAAAAVRGGGSSSSSSSSGGTLKTSVYAQLDVLTLGAEKKRIKQRLKAFDASFLHTHQRLPGKDEKEPIRGLYEEYHLVKAHLAAKEQQQQQQQPSPRKKAATEKKSMEGARKEAAAAAAAAVSFAGAPVSPSVPGAVGGAHPQVVVPPLTSSVDPTTQKAPNSGAIAVDALATSFTTLASEKRQLHEMLKRYEREFEDTHGRPVRTVEDIAVVQADYNRYKQIKQLLLAKGVEQPPSYHDKHTAKSSDSNNKKRDPAMRLSSKVNNARGSPSSTS